MRYAVNIEKKIFTVDLADSFFNEAQRLVSVGGQNYQLTVNRAHGILVLTNEQGIEQMLRVRSFFAEKYLGEPSTHVTIEMLASAAEGMQKVNMLLTPDVPGQILRTKHAATDDIIIRSQITGKVLAIDVNTGDRITQGQTLAVIEAMKMENRIFAGAEGTILSISINVGDSVATGKELFKIKRANKIST